MMEALSLLYRNERRRYKTLERKRRYRRWLRTQGLYGTELLETLCDPFAIPKPVREEIKRRYNRPGIV